MRFHMGISFRLKDLKKFIIPILIGIAAYFGFGGLFGGFIQVHAYINTDTIANFNIIEMTQEQKNLQFYADYSREQLLEYYSNYESNDFKIVTTFEYNGEVGIFIIPIVRTSLTLGFPISGQYMRAEDRLDTFQVRYVLLRRNINLNFQQSSTFSTIENCLSSNTCWSSGQTIENNYFDRNQLISSGFVGNLFQSSLLSNIDNNSNIDISESDVQSYVKYIYSSQIPLYIEYNNRVNTYYYKSIIINGIILESGDSIPTYKELFAVPPEPPLYEPNYDDNLKTIYLKIPVNHVQDFSYNSTFNINIPFATFEANIIDRQYIAGRIDNTNYYSYKNLSGNCSFDTDYSEPYNDVGSITIDSLSCDSSVNFSDYDYIYITYIIRYRDNNVNMLVNDYIGGINYGYSSEYSGSGGLIYEVFENLNNPFGLSLSALDSSVVARTRIFSNTNTDAVFITAYNNKGEKVNYNPTSGIVDNFFGNLLNISNNNGYTFSVYQAYDTSIPVSIYLYLDDAVIITLNNNNSDNFYYYDENGNIVNSNFDLTDRDVTANYNTSYYFGVVDNYINGLSVDISNFGSLIQQFYDSMPDFIQIFIFVTFILFCTYFTYLLIRK